MVLYDIASKFATSYRFSDYHSTDHKNVEFNKIEIIGVQYEHHNYNGFTAI